MSKGKVAYPSAILNTLVISIVRTINSFLASRIVVRGDVL